jgi:hypothetical protein
MDVWESDSEHLRKEMDALTEIRLPLPFDTATADKCSASGSLAYDSCHADGQGLAVHFSLRGRGLCNRHIGCVLHVLPRAKRHHKLDDSGFAGHVAFPGYSMGQRGCHVVHVWVRCYSERCVIRDSWGNHCRTSTQAQKPVKNPSEH